MSEVQTTGESSVQSIPEDFASYQQWRETGETPATQDNEKTPAASEEEAEPAKTATDSGTDDDTEQEGDDEKPAKKGGFQRRIDKLTRKNAELERLLAENAGKPAETAKPAESATPAGEPQAKDYDTYEAYVKALTIYELDARDQAKADAERKKALDAKATEVANTWQTRAEETRKQYADFDDVMEAGEDLPITPVMRDFLIDSEHGPELAYTLAKTPAEVERIAKLAPLAAARELTKLELALAPKTASKPKPRVTNAPEPIRPVSRTSAAAKTPLKDVDDFSEYERRRRAGER